VTSPARVRSEARGNLTAHAGQDHHLIDTASQRYLFASNLRLQRPRPLPWHRELALVDFEQRRG